ncbi:TraB/GumN family protein [Photobacterium sp. CCB-ST2H9]|uniref:TraB/GumN family protein n=1 Tax=Photobacterium sp. CCB-ST2H9 TaxID=2912855 RepID=UPI00200547B6|nr:TraB/GumN family protein [Photobacterium sp. CCB-ST2H9]UTM57986.1 TraB/GumN family protein [Photobacterium sp. CCB-ST2H9]
MFKSLLTKASIVLTFFSTSASAEPQVWLAKDHQRQFVLMGSIHVGNDALYPLPDVFTRYWPEANGLILEADIQKKFEMPPFDASTATRHLLPPKDIRTLKALADQYRLSSYSLLENPPWMTAMQLQLAQSLAYGLSPEKGIDQVVFARAQKEHLPVYELEGIEAQFRLLRSLPDHGLNLLQTTLNEWLLLEDELRCLLEAWQQGNGTVLTELSAQIALSDDTEQHLLTRRNQDWARQLAHAPQYQKGTFLVVVGAYHMMGNDGLPALLMQQGFTVRQLNHGRPAQCEPAPLRQANNQPKTSETKKPAQ